MFWICKTKEKYLSWNNKKKNQFKFYENNPCDLDDIELVEKSILKPKTKKEPNAWELLL